MQDEQRACNASAPAGTRAAAIESPLRDREPDVAPACGHGHVMQAVKRPSIARIGSVRYRSATRGPRADRATTRSRRAAGGSAILSTGGIAGDLYCRDSTERPA